MPVLDADAEQCIYLWAASAACIMSNLNWIRRRHTGTISWHHYDFSPAILAKRSKTKRITFQMSFLSPGLWVRGYFYFPRMHQFAGRLQHASALQLVTLTEQPLALHALGCLIAIHGIC